MSAGYEYDYELEEQIKRDIYLKRVENITRDHLNRYQNILNDIQIQGLDEYVYNDYISYENQLNFAFQCLSSDPERARDISMSIGKLIGALPKIAKERRRVYQKEEKERKIQRELQEKQLKQEFKDLIEEQLSKLKDPILRDFAQDELTILVKNFSEDFININNFEQVKLSFLRSSESILQTAQQKMNEFNEKYFQKIDIQMKQEALLEKVQEEKLNIKKIKTDDPAKLENIMNKLILTEKNINNGIINEDTDKFLNDISNEILNEEINEEYRRHTVKSILEILNKLGFQNVNPKKVGEDVKLYAKRINGNEFEATIKSNGTIMSHFNGYDYMACKDDIYSLEHELQNCYGIELNKTKTIWENPDRIQKNAKPLIELQKKG